MDILLSIAFAVTVFSVSLVLFRVLMIIALIGILAFYLCFLRALKREFSRPVRRATEYVT